MACMTRQLLCRSPVRYCELAVLQTSGFSTTSHAHGRKSYKLVIAGGGTGGAATANKFATKLGAGNVALIEPNEDHYYQPMWTLVGAGVKTFQQSSQPLSSILPRSVNWVKDRVASYDPDNNVVTTASGEELEYEYLVVATGIQLRYDLVPGLQEALDNDPNVVSNYHRDYVLKTFPAINNFTEGNAIFTMPSTPVKCAGAPQKIMYLTDYHFRKMGKRDKANVMFNSALGVIFGVKKYADVLTGICKDRNITVNLKHNLVEVKHEQKEAIFAVGEERERVAFPYSLLHVAPPMSAPADLRGSPLANEAGFCDVNQYTLQHTRYPNVFSVGDGNSVPTSKTAAAVAGQMGILSRNLTNVMAGKPVGDKQYDGYTSCPLITSVGKCVLAEFGFDGKVMETFPLDQGKERRSMYQLKANVMPQMYFKMLVKGWWNGPGTARKMMKLWMGE